MFGNYVWNSVGRNPRLPFPQSCATSVPADVSLHAVSAPCLTIGNLSLRRRGHLLIEGLSVEVAPGTTLAVMGPSGAGKSTLLRTIAGLAAPDEGNVSRPDGQVPIVFQDPRLLPWRTALDNVALVAGSRDLATRWLERVGLLEAANVYPRALSGGMRQRVTIARALAADSQIFLVDEPFANLDQTTAQRLRSDLIEHLAAAQKTSVWVTHDPLDATVAADRTLVLAGPPSGHWLLVDHARSASSPADGLARLRTALQQPSSP